MTVPTAWMTPSSAEVRNPPDGGTASDAELAVMRREEAKNVPTKLHPWSLYLLTFPGGVGLCFLLLTMDVTGVLGITCFVDLILVVRIAVLSFRRQQLSTDPASSARNRVAQLRVGPGRRRNMSWPCIKVALACRVMSRRMVVVTMRGGPEGRGLKRTPRRRVTCLFMPNGAFLEAVSRRPRPSGSAPSTALLLPPSPRTLTTTLVAAALARGSTWNGSQAALALPQFVGAARRLGRTRGVEARPWRPALRTRPTVPRLVRMKFVGAEPRLGGAARTTLAAETRSCSIGKLLGRSRGRRLRECSSPPKVRARLPRGDWQRCGSVSHCAALRAPPQAAAVLAVAIVADLRTGLKVYSTARSRRLRWRTLRGVEATLLQIPCPHVK